MFRLFSIRKRIYLILLLAVGSPLPLLADVPMEAAEQIAQWGFPVGEEMVYRAYWGAIRVGDVVVRTDWKDGAKGELIQLTLEVRSNRAIALVYPVTIDVESVLRAEDFLPIRHTQRRREGRRRAHVVVDFDHEKGIAIQNEKLRERITEIEIEDDTRDIFTFLYYVRRYPMELGNKAHYQVLTDDKIYDLWLHVAEDSVMVSSILDDDVEAFHVDPEAAFDGVFRREGQLEIQVSKDARQLMLAKRANIPIGSIRTVLREVRGPGEDNWGRYGASD